jgi:hypothetical protein
VNPTRRATLIGKKLRAQGAVATDAQVEEFLRLGSTQVEAIYSLRSMLIPPAPPGAGDTQNDDIDPVEYRRALNRRKRERKARAT